MLWCFLLGFATLLLTVWYVHFQIKRKRLYELASRFDGPPTVPLLGNILKCLVPPEDAVQGIIDATKYYQSPTRVWFGPHLVLHIWDPKQIEIILNSPQFLHKDPYLATFVRSVFGNSLVCSPVEQWKRHRRMIAPAFNQKDLEAYFTNFREYSKKLVTMLRTEEGKGIFNAEKYFIKCTMEIILETILNFSGNKNCPNIEDIVDWLEVLQTVMIIRCSKVWMFPDFIFNRTALGKKFNEASTKFNAYVDSVMEQWKEEALIKQGREQLHTTDFRRPPRLAEHLLLTSDENGKFTTEELRDEVKTMIIAGMETTSSAIGYLLIAIAMHPEIQQKLYEEIMEIVGPTREIEYEDIKHLDYLDRVLKETLRILPGGGGLARYCEHETQVGEHIIPAGTTIIISIVGAHRDPNIWPNPTKFDPDRFLPEEVAKRSPCSWVPFSAGPRNCIGMRFGILEMKTFIIELVRTFEVTTSYKTIEDIKLTMMGVTKPTHGFQLGFNSRA